MYAIGGNPGGYVTNTVEAYDPIANIWSSRAAMPTARWLLGAVQVNGIVYAVGRNNCCTALSTVEAYDPVADMWSSKAAMPTARNTMGVVEVNGIVYAIGGDNGSGTVLSTVEAYDPVANTWSSKAAMPTARRALTAAAVNGIVYAIGGTDGSTNLSTVEAYDPVANTWSSNTAMPTARYNLAAATVNRIVYAIGGYNGDSLATNEAFTPPPPACVDPPSGMISWWPGDCDASDIIDGNNGTLQNGATLVTGIVGQAFSFNGANQYILVGDPVPPSLQIQNEITLLAWIYATGYPGPSTLGLIVGSQYDTATAGATIFLDGRTSPDGQAAPPGHIHFQIGDGSWHTTNVNAQVPLNEWVHIAATRKANEDAKVYYNGELQPLTSLPWAGSISYSGAWFAIGQQKDIDRPFNGLIDEVEIYNRALTADEIQAISNAGGSGQCKSLAAPTANSATNVTTGSFTANWSSVSGASGYKLDVSTDSSFGSYVSGYENLDVGNVTSQSISGLQANTTYYYRVRAYNCNGTSGNSNVISVLTAPAAPKAKRATNVTTSSFTANWSSVSGATGYRLDVSTSGSFSTYVSGYQNLDVGNVTSQSVSGLSANTRYHYRVRAGP